MNLTCVKCTSVLDKSRVGDVEVLVEDLGLRAGRRTEPLRPVAQGPVFGVFWAVAHCSSVSNRRSRGCNFCPSFARLVWR